MTRMRSDPATGLRRESVDVGGKLIPFATTPGAGPGASPIVALHGSFGRGITFEPVAALLESHVRIIAPDQRGHGENPHAGGGIRSAFVDDAARFIEALGVAPVPVLGHSLGGITAYQLAARYPELVSALVVEDVGPVMRSPAVEHPVLDVRGWPQRAPTREALAARLRASSGLGDVEYFMASAAFDGTGWHFLFDWNDMMAVQNAGVGDWWHDWLGSRCPALVLRGARSTMLPADLAHEMVERRPDSRLIEFAGAGHWIHDHAPHEFARALAAFLTDIPR